MGHCFRLCLCLCFVIVTACAAKHKKREFKVDYKHNQFLKDGKPFQYVSGSLHYFRVPQEYWQDRLRKLRAAGLNAVCTYIEWSSHEPRLGEYDFTGDNDIEYFITLAQQEGLLVILRPGPYICAERDFGGYPPWLLHENPNMVLRTNDSTHTHYVYKWLRVLLPKLQPYLYANGGPVIMVQIENEYGSYDICDRNYTLWLRDVFQSYIGTKAVLFTTDGGGDSEVLQCGTIPDVFATVDFGSGVDVQEQFEPLRKIQPHGPLVNSEFYPGWLTHWGEPESTVNITPIINTTRDLFAINASFNYYVFFGGTNFGFTSGANNPPFNPDITSYDYDAPISEAGDLTDKYYAIQSVISEYLPVWKIPIRNSTKAGYGKVALDAKVSLLESDLGIVYNNSTYPQTFEALELYSGLLWYETTLPPDYLGRGLLEANGVHDRAIVYVNKKAAGILNRTGPVTSLYIAGKANQPLSLLVENQGHINYGKLFDLKGLVQNVTLDGEILTNWKQTGYSLTNVSHISNLPPVKKVKVPAFYSAKFQLPETIHKPHDTFVDMTGWSKGVLYVNGHNLGRYWPVEGPQITLYLPGPYLCKYPEYNTVVVLELEKPRHDKVIDFVAAPIWGLNDS